MFENRLKIFCVLLSPAILLAGAREFQEVALSPDGRQVAWVEDGAIYLKEWRAEAPPARVADHARALAWAPDSQRLAFLSDSEHAGQAQLYVLADGHTPAR